jgi:hypothetical protein
LCSIIPFVFQLCRTTDDVFHARDFAGMEQILLVE